jgi:hypothetical protein
VATGNIWIRISGRIIAEAGGRAEMLPEIFEGILADISA